MLLLFPVIFDLTSSLTPALASRDAKLWRYFFEQGRFFGFWFGLGGVDFDVVDEADVVVVGGNGEEGELIDACQRLKGLTRDEF